MAVELNLSRTIYYQYEKGVSIPGVEVLLEISKRSNLSLGVLSALAVGKSMDEALIYDLAIKVARLTPEERRFFARLFNDEAAGPSEQPWDGRERRASGRRKHKPSEKRAP